PIAVLAVAGLHRALAGRAGTGRRIAIAAMAGVAAAGIAVGLIAAGSTRADQDRLVAAVTRHPATVTVTTIEALPRVAWRVDDRVTWMLAKPAELEGMLAHLRSEGVPRVAVVTYASTAPSVPSAAGAAASYPNRRLVGDRDAASFGV